MKTIKLTHIAIYKDGGSKSYKGSNGKMYWQSYKFGIKNAAILGRIFEGNINDENPELAKGRFIINTTIVIQN